MPVQQYSDEMIALLAGVFQSRYEPNFAWKSAASALAMLPGLRGAWTMGSFDENGDQYDISGQGRTLSYNGNPAYSNAQLMPFVGLDGAGDYLDRADEAGLDITGTETYIAATRRGLTLGAWVYPTADGAVQSIIGKWNENAVDERSYLIDVTAADVFRFRVTSLGTAATVVTVTSTVTVTANNWYFVEGTYDPSTRMAINVNGTIDENLVGIPASIYSGAADFVIGARDNGASALLTGRVSLSWLCAMYHQDYQTEVIREQTRAMVGI